MSKDYFVLKQLFSQFNTQGTFNNARSFGSGHINDTYLIKTTEDHFPDYILQRINTQIFTNPQALMKNILLVTQHIKTKLNALSHIQINRKCLTIISSTQDLPYTVDSQGNYWACYLYIADSNALDNATNTKQAYEGGKLIGRFHELVSDLDANQLHITLPRFHDVEFRIDNLKHAISSNTLNRAQICHKEIKFVESQADKMMQIMKLAKQQKIPLRIVHNDTKFNNLLLDADDNGLCVIDLDTVMPGYIHYDFSDAARTIANSTAEDEKNLNNINFDLILFKAFCTGFLSELGQTLTDEEINSLGIAVPLMPFLHGIRFLTDYLMGDKYYKIHFPNHNLQRAQAQFQLVRCMLDKMPDIQFIIQELCNSSQPLLNEPHY
jgi:Ser/Thr protein kinase RdoA (MazF antagonist)